MLMMTLNTGLIIALLFAIKYVRDFFQKYESYVKLKDDLVQLVKHVEATIDKADNTTRVFQDQIHFASHNVIPHMPKAHIAKEDLSFLVSHGEEIADRLEHLTRDAKRTFLHPSGVVFSNVNQMDKSNVVALEAGGGESSKEDSPYIHTTVQEDGTSIERRGLYTTVRRA